MEVIRSAEMFVIFCRISGPVENVLYRIWGSHSGGYEEFYLLEYDAV
jgi:hypothetical protein